MKAPVETTCTPATNRRWAIRRGIVALTLLAGCWSLGPRHAHVVAQTGAAPGQGQESTDEPLPPAYYPPGQGPADTPADQPRAASLPSQQPAAAPAPASNWQAMHSETVGDTIHGQPLTNGNSRLGPTTMEIRPRDEWPRPQRLETAEPVQACIVNHFVDSQTGALQVDTPSDALANTPPKEQRADQSPPERPPYVGQLLNPPGNVAVEPASSPTNGNPYLFSVPPVTRQQDNAVALPQAAALKMAQAPIEVIAPERIAPEAPSALPERYQALAPPEAGDGSALAGPVSTIDVGDDLHCTNSSANAPFDDRVFIPDPDYLFLPYNAEAQLGIYGGKYCVPAQAPWVELWRGLYRAGPLPPAGTFLTGETNPIIPHFLLFGDYRTAIAYNDNGPDDEEVGVWAHRLNLDFDLKITSTERIHAFWGPLDDGGKFTRAEFRDDNIELREEFDDDFDTLFFEGDMGYIWGGMTDRWAPFDLPFVAGKYPLLFQNGIWMVDAIEGFAFTIPGRNSPLLDWSNFEITFFVGFDDVDSPAFRGNDNTADVYGVITFIEAYEGYLELGYAFLNDGTGQGLSYNNIGLAYTRRYFQRVSSSVRAILNTGQEPVLGEQTADGQLLLWENSLITSYPNYLVPYLNMFAGFDRPQSVARAGGAGGILLNTGINFETDGLTGYPTLDATANDTWGGALGVNLLGPGFCWQLVTELATVQTFGNGGQRQAVADQYAAGMRFQYALNNAWILRLDGMYGIFEDAADIRGARAELRWKF